MPRRARRCAGLVVIAVSANISDPAHVGTSPEIALKNVVFPAPLGPIKPSICPASISRSTRSTAVRPPKRTVTPDPRNLRPNLPPPACVGTEALSRHIRRRPLPVAHPPPRSPPHPPCAFTTSPPPPRATPPLTTPHPT